MKKVSIIIPVYNTSKYLERCLNSIIKEKLEDIEIICVNDGSTDGSLKILRKYEKIDKRIIVINKKNGGSSSARNEALRIAQGEYCLNIDSDDWIDEGYIETMYKKAKQNDLDMLIADIFYDYGEYNKIREIKDLEIDEKRVLTGEEYLQIFFKDNFHGYTWNKLIKREYYLKNNIFYNEEIFLYEDVEVIVKLSLSMARIGKINRAFYHYRQGENNGSRKIKLSLYSDIEECFNNIKSYFKLLNINIYNEIIENRRLYSLFSEILAKNYIEKELYSIKRNKLLEELRQKNKAKNKEGLMNSKNIRLYLILEKYISNKVVLFEIIKKLFQLKLKLNSLNLKLNHYKKLRLNFINLK